MFLFIVEDNYYYFMVMISVKSRVLRYLEFTGLINLFIGH